jgi:hypothetical protein
MLDAWAKTEGIALIPGTLNLCSDRAVDFRDEGISLGVHAHLAQPAWRRDVDGFSPRLYRAELDRTVCVWVYRWSDAPFLRAFVGDADGCGAEDRVEVVSGLHLASDLGLEPGDRLRLVVPTVSLSGR